LITAKLTKKLLWDGLQIVLLSGHFQLTIHTITAQLQSHTYVDVELAKRAHLNKAQTLLFRFIVHSLYNVL